MEQKFSTAVAISERLIHTAYSNRLSPGALDHEALIAVVKYVNDIAQNSDNLSRRQFSMYPSSSAASPQIIQSVPKFNQHGPIVKF